MRWAPKMVPFFGPQNGAVFWLVLCILTQYFCGFCACFWLLALHFYTPIGWEWRVACRPPVTNDSTPSCSHGTRKASPVEGSRGRPGGGIPWWGLPDASRYHIFIFFMVQYLLAIELILFLKKGSIKIFIFIEIIFINVDFFFKCIYVNKFPLGSNKSISKNIIHIKYLVFFKNL